VDAFLEGGLMICPRCMQEQPAAHECVNCGVIIEKYVIANHDSLSSLDGVNNPNKTVRLDPALLEKGHRHVRVSSTYKIILVFFILVMLSYVAAVFITDVAATDEIEANVTEALQTDLRHELKAMTVAEKVSWICKRQRIFVDCEEIIVEYLPDTVPLKDERIYYIVRVKVPYEINLFHFIIPTEIIVESHDSISDDNLTAAKFKSDLGIY
jgi:hypothetical protein